MGAHVCAPACASARLRAREKLDCSQMKTLVIAEKPSVAQDIVRALTPTAGKFEKHAEHFENDEYVVTSAVGHLVEIKAPEAYDVKRDGTTADTDTIASAEWSTPALLAQDGAQGAQGRGPFYWPGG